ncbi:MAG: CoA-binding protein [Candidatus Bilamarchaeaceae archaeon]
MNEMNAHEFISKGNIVAVVGASRDPEKFGHNIFKRLEGMGFNVYPVNPNAEEIDGKRCYPDLKSIPHKPTVVISVVPPQETEALLLPMRNLGINKLWMQPGSESQRIYSICERLNIKFVSNACFVVDGLKEKL